MPKKRRTLREREREERLNVSTNAYYGGVRSGEYSITISLGDQSITATAEMWSEALDEAYEDIRNAEREY